MSPSDSGSLFPNAFNRFFRNLSEDLRGSFWESSQNSANYILKFGKAPISQRLEEGRGGGAARRVRNAIRCDVVVMLTPLSCRIKPAMTCLNQPSSSPAESDWPHDNPDNDDRQRYALVFATERRARNETDILIAALGTETPAKNPRPNSPIRYRVVTAFIN